MKFEYLIIKDESILKKLEELLWIGIDSENGRMSQVLLRNKSVNIYTGKEVINYSIAISELKGFLFPEFPKEVELDELDKCINNFLFLLRVNVEEASICVERFLDVMIANIPFIINMNFYKRLHCILTAIYLTCFCKKQNQLLQVAFYSNIVFLKEEDKSYLIDIFVKENDFEKLDYIIFSYCETDNSCQNSISFIKESLQVVYEKFNAIIYKYFENILLGNSRYEDVYKFIRRIKLSDVGRILNVEIPSFNNNIKIWLLILALRLQIKDEIPQDYKANDELKNNDKYPYLMFYYAQFYRTESMDKEENERKSLLCKAKECIKIAKKESLSFSGFELITKTEIYIEELRILVEMEDYKKAYDTMCSEFDSLFIDNHFLMLISVYYLIVLKKKDNTKEIEKIIEFLDEKYNINANVVTNPTRIFEPIVNFVNKNEYLKKHSDIRFEIYSNLLIMMGYVELILHKSRIRDISKYNILYYTRIDNLRLLLEDEKDKVKYRLPLFHANHMNDPEEGEVFKKYLINNYYPPHSQRQFSSNREIYDENFVFIKSFFCIEKSKFNELLPMWVQYGNDANGVCILLNESTFDNLKLLRINYLDDYGECVNNSEINELLDNYIEAFRSITDLYTRQLEREDELVEEINDLLEYINSRILYLFKHESYKHENEARIIVSRTSSDLDDVKTIPGTVPKLFIYSNCQSYIDEIILGSKMEVPDNLVPFIHYHGRKMWANNEKKKQITVSNSSIQYR